MKKKKLPITAVLSLGVISFGGEYHDTETTKTEVAEKE